jgi:hypothetical protein
MSMWLGGAESAGGALVGNKADLEQRRVISAEAGVALARKMGISYFDVSAVCDTSFAG